MKHIYRRVQKKRDEWAPWDLFAVCRWPLWFYSFLIHCCCAFDNLFVCPLSVCVCVWLCEPGPPQRWLDDRWNCADALPLCTHNTEHTYHGIFYVHIFIVFHRFKLIDRTYKECVVWFAAQWPVAALWHCDSIGMHISVPISHVVHA